MENDKTKKQDIGPNFFFFFLSTSARGNRWNLPRGDGGEKEGRKRG